MMGHATDDLYLRIKTHSGEVHTVPFEYHILGGVCIVSHLGEAPVMGIDECTHCAVEKFAKEYIDHYNGKLKIDDDRMGANPYA